MMSIKNTISTVVIALSSSIACADSYFHPVTKDLVFDESSVEFSENCGFSEVSFNEDGSLDLVYNDFIAIATGSEVENLVCQFKIDVAVPAGWKVKVSTEAGVGGNHVGTNIASFSHTVAGTVKEAGFKYLLGDGAFVIEESLKTIGSSACGKDLTLKTVANLIAIGNDGFSLVNLNNGSLNGTTSSWKYHWSWEAC